jgi:hypothetical protein
MAIKALECRAGKYFLGMGTRGQGDKEDKGVGEAGGEIFLFSYPFPLSNCPLPNYLTTNSSHGLTFAGNSETRRNGS